MSFSSKDFQVLRIMVRGNDTRLQSERATRRRHGTASAAIRIKSEPVLVRGTTEEVL